MENSASILLALLNSLVIALVVGLIFLYARRQKDLALHRFSRPFLVIFSGIAITAVTYLLDILMLTGLVAAPQKSTASVTLLHLGYILGNLVTYMGMAFFINRVIPVSSRYVKKLAESQEELAASNDELVKTVASRNQELEISNMTLRQVLEDQQVSRVALLESEKKFRTLFDASPALFITVNHLHTITEINRFGAQTLGYGAATLVGEPFGKIVAVEDSDKQQAFLDLCFANSQETSETELRLVKNNTQSLWVKASGSVVENKDGDDYLLMVCQDISESKSLAESLSYQAKHDDLTGLFNRRALEDFLVSKLERLTAIAKPIALIYLDLDQLKVINDTCGHRAGDELIRLLVQRINEFSAKFDFFARVGGDEFALVICETSRHEALETAELIRNIAEDLTFTWQENSYRQSISIGLALTSRNLRTLTDLFAAADAACYTAKERGRNRVVVQEDAPEHFDANRNEMLWVSRLQTALMRDRFELYFQPIVNLSGSAGDYIHYEMLIRYVDNDGTHISPDKFLPAAERFGLASQIDLWVLTTTLDFLDKHPEHTRSLSCCSINLSSHSLSNHQSRMAIKQLVLTANLPKYKLCFEITETNAIHNLEEAIEFVNELKIIGCKFALDDFGTGFSSFGYLKNLDVDFIKIDGSFITDIVDNKLGRAMVKAMNAIAVELGISTIAEYAETPEIISELIQMKVTYGQGFGLAKPMPVPMLEDFYKRQSVEVSNS